MKRIAIIVALFFAVALPAYAQPKKFTDLPAASTLAGTEVLPLDQPNGSGGYTTSQALLSAILKAIQSPTVSQKGGVFSAAATTNQFMTGVDTNGNAVKAQPAFSNLSGAPSSTQASGGLDAIASTRGAVLYRGSSAWAVLAPGTSGYVLKSAGAGADPVWGAAGGTGTVTSATIAVPAGMGGGCTITSSGTCTLTWSGQIPYTSMPALTGDVTTSAGAVATTIANGAVTSAKMASGAAVANIGFTPLNPADNLSDVPSKSSARTNLELGSAATQSTGTSGATVPLLNGNNVQSGKQTWTGALNVPTRAITASGAITVSNTTDYLICVNKTTGAATAVNLPGSPATGDTYLIKDCKGDAATNNITVTPASGTIDGASTYVMSQNRASVAVTFNGSEWSVN